MRIILLKKILEIWIKKSNISIVLQKLGKINVGKNAAATC